MVGEFKDDQEQEHFHSFGVSTHEPRFNTLWIYSNLGWRSGDSLGNGTGTINSNLTISDISSPNTRKGDITRGKSKGIKYIIKVL